MKLLVEDLLIPTVLSGSPDARDFIDGYAYLVILSGVVDFNYFVGVGGSYGKIHSPITYDGNYYVCLVESDGTVYNGYWHATNSYG